jgi:hypothetical protein
MVSKDAVRKADFTKYKLTLVTKSTYQKVITKQLTKKC